MEMPVNASCATFTQAVACGCPDEFWPDVLVNNPGKNYQLFFVSGRHVRIFHTGKPDMASCPLP
jgi:hypothetical protein